MEREKQEVAPPVCFSEEAIFALAKQKEKALSPVDPRVQVAVVIPVYKEYTFGRIMEVLADLKAQTLPHHAYEALLVVNNQEYGKKGYDGEAAQDNRTLIEEVNKKKQAGELPMVHIIDCTQGELGHKNIGAAWGLGNEIAKNRFEQTNVGKQGVLVRLDADVSIPQDFLSTLLDIYNADPAIDAVTIPRLPLPIDYESDDMYLGNAHEFIEKVVDARHHASRDIISGPTISFRAKFQEQSEMHTYMSYRTNSDFQMGKSLGIYTNFVVSSFPRVYVGDRIRKEGIDANARISFVDTHIRWKVARDAYRLLAGADTTLPHDAFYYVDLQGEMEWCKNIIKTFRPAQYATFLTYQVEEEQIMRSLLTLGENQDIALLATYMFALGRILLEE